MTDISAHVSTPYEKAAAMRQAGIDIPPHPKAGAGDGQASGDALVPAEKFLLQCEAWKVAVEEAHRIWKPDGQ
ncbi:MAG: hypothetical protein REJ50_14470 [Bordetella sp.]|nr:hypothetical protein [Bordetella sp.]